MAIFRKNSYALDSKTAITERVDHTTVQTYLVAGWGHRNNAFGATTEQVSKSIHNKAKNIYITICWSSKWSGATLQFYPILLFECQVQILKICLVEETWELQGQNSHTEMSPTPNHQMLRHLQCNNARAVVYCGDLGLVWDGELKRTSDLLHQSIIQKGSRFKILCLSF